MDEIGIGLKFKTTYEGLAEGKQDLQQLKKIIDSIDTDGVDLKVNNAGIDQAKIQMQALERSIKEAEASGGDFGQIFKANLNSIQSEALQTTTSIRSTEQSIKSLNNASKQGSNGGFSSLSTAARLATKEIQGTTGQLDQLRNNMQQGLGQSIAFGAIGLVTGGIVSALSTAKDLDKVSTDISIVSGKTRDEMEAYRDAASEAADILGTTTKKYMEASLIYEQQGGDAAYYASELAKSTVVAANVSGVATDQMSEYLTSTINGFQMLKDKGGEAGTYITDVLAKLGAASGSDLGEVATGLSRTANTAKDAKYEFEEISSAIATVSEVTRRTPQTIGTAFKTILTSFTQLRDAGKDEVDAFTTKVNDALKKGGITDIPLFDNGNLRAASDIFKDIAGEWDTMNTTQQALVSEAIAGKQQAEVLRAFFNNQERYQDLLGQAYDSSGTAAQQQLIYMDSLQAKTEALSNGWQGVVDKVVDSDMFKGVLDDLTNLLKLVSSAKTGMGGMATIMAPLVGVGGQLFGAKKISEGYSNKALNNQSKQLLATAKELEKSKENDAKSTAEEYKTASKLNNVLRTLGGEAGKRYESSLNELTKLKKEIAMIPQPDQIKEESEKAGKALASGGGYKGITTRDFSPEVQSQYLKEDKYTSALARIDALQKAMPELEKEAKKNAKAFLDWDDAVNGSNLYESKEPNQAPKTVSGKEKELVDWADNYGKALDKNNELSEVFGEKMKAVSDQIENAIGSTYKLNEAREEAIKLETQIKESLVNTPEQDVADNNLKAAQDELKSLKAGVEDGGYITKEAKEKVYTRQAAQQYTEQVGSVDDKRVQAKILEKSLENANRIANRTRKLERAISGASLAYSTIVPVIASYNAVQEGTLTKQDGVISSMQGVSTMLLSSMNPYLMAGGAVVGALSMVVDKLDLFKSKVEKAKEINEEFIKSFISLQETTSGNLTSLGEIEDVYSSFQGLDAQGILDGGDSEQIESYSAMAERLLTVYPDLLRYYDKNGIAVVDLTKSMTKLKEEQNQVAQSNSEMMVDNSSNFFVQYSNEITGAEKKLDSYNKKLQEAKNSLSYAQSIDDSEGINDALKEIESANKKISELSTKTKDAKANIQANIVSPFVEASVTIQTLSEKSQALIKSFASDNMNSKIVSNLFDDKDGDQKLVSYEGSIKAITAEMEKLEKTAEGSSQVVVDTFNGYSEISKNLVMFSGKTVSSYADFTDQITKANNATKDLFDSTNELKSLNSEAFNLEKVNLTKLSGMIQDEKDESTKEKNLNTIKNIEKENPTGDYGENSQAVQNALEYAKVFDNKKDEKFSSKEEKENLEKVTEELVKQGKAQDKLEDAYEASLDTLEGTQEVMDSMSDNASVADILNNENITFGDKIKQISDLMPDLGDSMSDAFEKGGKSASDQANIIESALGTAMSNISASIMATEGDSKDYYASWAANNADTLKQMAKTFGIDTDNIRTLNELKEAALSGELKGNIDLYNAKGTASANFVNQDNENLKTQEANLNSSLLAQLDSVGQVEVQKRATTAVSAKMQYSESIGWFKKLLAEMGGKDVYTDKEKYLKAYEKEYNKTLALELEKYQIEQKSAGIDTKKRDSISAVFNNILGNSKIDTSGPLDDMLSKINSAKAALAQNGSDSDSDSETTTSNEKATKSEVANLELELDRYYKLENILKTIEKRYSELSDAKDAAYGKDRLKIMEQEESLLVEKAATTKQYIVALRQEQSETRATLANSGFGFDANGDISNLNEKLKAMQANANSLTGDAKESAIDAVQKMQDVAERYQEITFGLIPDKQETLNEIKKTLSDLESEKIDYKVKLVVDKEDFKNQVLDVVKEMQDSYADLDEKAQIAGKSMSSAMSMVSYWKSMIAEVNKNTKLTDADRQEKLDDYNSKLLGAVSDARAGYEDLQSAQADFVSQSIDAIDKVNDRYENIISKASALAEKTKDLYGPQAYDKIAEYYGVQEDAINSQIANLQESQKLLIKYRDSIEEGSEAWESANDKINEMGDAISEAILSKLDLIQQKFDNFTDSLFSSFDKMFGVDGLSGAVDDFDDLIAKQNKYFSNFDKFTTISTEIKKVNDQIAATNDPEKAKILAKYRDKELASLLEQEKITQDDYDRAQKIYDIKLKELALQERQDAKRTAQLVRDQNGNMTYEYVRTESEDVSEDLKELQEQKDSLYDFDSDKIKDAAKGVYDVISQYQSDLAALKDKGLSTEDYQEELKKMLAEAESDVKDKTDEMNKWISNAAKDGMDSLKTMVSSGTVTPDQLGVDQNTINSIFAGMDDGSLTVQDMLSGNYSDFANSLGMSSEDLAGTMDKILQLIMGDNLDIAQAMTDASNKWTSSAQSNVDELGNAYGEYMNIANGVLGDYNSSTGDLNNLLNDTNNASRQVIGTINSQTEAMLNAQKQNENTTKSVQNLQNALIGNNGASGLYGSMIQLQNTMNGELQPSYINTGAETDILSGKTYVSAQSYEAMANTAHTAYGQVNSFRDEPTKKAMGSIDQITTKTTGTANAFTDTANDAATAKRSIQDFSSVIQTLQGYGAYKVTNGPTKPVGMASGGYTGTWDHSTNNSEGRLAVLHEKELVLNSQDTENLLSAVNMQRSLMESIKGRGTSSTVNTVRNIDNSIKNLQSDNSKTQTVEQQITLAPTFPNAQNRSEIEGALQGLLVKATTYVGKTTN